MTMLRRAARGGLAAALAWGMMFPGSVEAADQPAPCHDEASATASAGAPAALRPEVVAGRPEVPDLLLSDQDGRPVHFYRDLVQGRLVAMNFIFTTCSTICPPLGANFARLERVLAERGGPPVTLISVSIDPATDTPARLRDWREKLQGGRGSTGAEGAASPWTLVTGPRQEMTALLKALQAYTPDKARHTPFLLLGNEATGQWRRVYGLTPPAELAKLLSELATPAARRAASTTAPKPVRDDAP